MSSAPDNEDDLYVVLDDNDREQPQDHPRKPRTPAQFTRGRTSAPEREPRQPDPEPVPEPGWCPEATENAEPGTVVRRRIEARDREAKAAARARLARRLRMAGAALVVIALPLAVAKVARQQAGKKGRALGAVTATTAAVRSSDAQPEHEEEALPPERERAPAREAEAAPAQSDGMPVPRTVSARTLRPRLRAGKPVFLVLQNGEVVEGFFLEATTERVSFRIDNGVVRYPLKEIRDVQQTDGTSVFEWAILDPNR